MGLLMGVAADSCAGNYLPGDGEVSEEYTFLK
jgi:hypothetical protein